jgi:hypothetical protein
MALQNPNGLYTGGVVNLNPMPYVNIINQARAKKQAREDAIDQYYRKLPDTLNDKGVRDQDRPVIEEYRNKIYEYGIKNKDLLRKGDGASQLEMEKLFREANAAAEKSKNLGKRALERGKMYLNKENRWVVDDDEYMAAEDLESKPINDPAHREMDMPALLSNKPFDESEFGKEIKGKIKYGTKAVRQTDPTNPLYDIVSEVPNIDPKTAEQIYSFASEKVNGNKRFEKFIKNKTPEQLTELNRVSMKVFGHPIREDFAEEDAAAAYTILQIPVTSSKEKSQQDTGAVMDRKWDEWFKKNKITDQQKRERIRLNKEGGGVYEIDNVPFFVRENSYTEPSIYGDFKVMDATKLSEGQMEDIFGKKGGQWGERPYKPIEANGKKLIKILPEGFEVRDANGNPVMIKDDEVIVSTHKRTVSKNKPQDLKKMKVRGTAPGQNSTPKKGKYD